MENTMETGSAFVPQCEEDGSFIPKQCFAEVDMCWCVDDYGKEVTDTSVPYNASDTLECSELPSLIHGFLTFSANTYTLVLYIGVNVVLH